MHEILKKHTNAFQIEKKFVNVNIKKYFILNFRKPKGFFCKPKKMKNNIIYTNLHNILN